MAQPKRLAVLVYLLLARPRGFQRRDVILATFWPELDAKRARHALSQAIHFLKRELGGDVIVTRGRDELRVNDDVLTCDAVAFEQALDAGDLEAAVERYRGDFLAGFFVADTAAFENWMELERARLRSRAAVAARQLAERRAADGRSTSEVHLAGRAAELDPLDEKAQRRLMRALDRAGDRAGALRAYDAFSRRLADELDAEPSPETQALRDAIRARSQAGNVSADVVPPRRSPVGSAAPQRAGPHWRRVARIASVSALAAAVAAASIVVWRRDPGQGAPEGASLGVVELYQRGRYLLRGTGDEQQVRAAVDFFTRAIARDSTYAPAHAGLADAFVQLTEFVSPIDLLPRARAAAVKALSLDGSEPGARLAVADLNLVQDLDWSRAEREYLAALRLDPESVPALERYARFLAAGRRHAELLDVTRKALELGRRQAADAIPFALHEHSALADAYLAGRRYDLAVEHANRALEMDPSAWPARATLGQAYVEVGRHADGIAELERAWRGSQRLPVFAYLGYAYGRAGRTADARNVLRELQGRGDTSYVPRDHIALVQLGLGDRAAAVASLQTAAEERHTRLPWLNQFAPFDALRSDSAFMRLLATIGVP